MNRNAVALSIVVPVHNNPGDLRECVARLLAAADGQSEIIVVDDGSTDDTPAVAAGLGVRVERLVRNSGPAAARNHGARHALGEILFFVDTDVLVDRGAVTRVRQTFASRPEVAAVFGSYDARPRAVGLVSQYRNLLHHFVHQQGNPAASTFWAGCGAVRRRAFEQTGGFDARRFPRPSIEDIELGLRLRRAGYRILLDKDLQGTHLKRWTLLSMLRTDVRDRALPWSRLILDGGEAPNDLNLRGAQRLAAALTGLAGIFLLLGVLRREMLLGAAASLLAVLGLNWRLYAFFLRERGVLFALGCVPLHLLYYLYSGLTYQGVWIVVRLRGLTRRRAGVAPRGSSEGGPA